MPVYLLLSAWLLLAAPLAFDATPAAADTVLRASAVSAHAGTLVLVGQDGDDDADHGSGRSYDGDDNDDRDSGRSNEDDGNDDSDDPERHGYRGDDDDRDDGNGDDDDTDSPDDGDRT
jgi:hypothetical protein